MLTVACVLKSGGDYWPEHVQALRDGVERNLSLAHRFVCLTDMEVDCERLPLRNGWPGWWSKLELFDGRLEGSVVYLDLDTIVVGSLDEIAIGHRFTVLRNFWAEVYGEHDRIGSGLMAWDCDLSAIYHAFAAEPERFIREYKTRAKWGDQGFIKDHTPVEPERWQDKHPGKVVSFKKHVRPAGRVPVGAAIVAFHGQPRPFDLSMRQRAWFQEAMVAA
jgi:hypothetical protein